MINVHKNKYSPVLFVLAHNHLHVVINVINMNKYYICKEISSALAISW